MADEVSEPQGLGMSLDDLIKNKRDDHHEGGYGKQRGRSHQRGHQRSRFDGGRQQQYGRHDGQGGYGQRGFQQQSHQQVDQYRMHQSCYVDDEGILVFKFRKTEIVRVTPNGDITLTSDGYHNTVTLASLNDILNPVGIRVSSPAGDVAGDWTVSDGKALVRFHDGVVLAGKGPVHMGRAKALKEAFENPNRAMVAAAAAASNAAAAQSIGFTGAFAGGRGRGGMPMMMGGPQMMMMAGAGNMMFPQQQQFFPQQQQQRGRGRGRGRNTGTRHSERLNQQHEEPSVFQRLGGKSREGEEEEGEIQRLKRQGRYHPY